MNEKPVSELLSHWKLDAEVPATFSSTVWRRIESQASRSVGSSIVHWLEGLFSRPAVVVGYASLAIVLGLAAAQVRSSNELRSLESQLEARYVQSIDPYSPRGPE